VSGSAITKNVIFNLIGLMAPMLAAVFAMPVLISRMGTDKFGILTITWMVLGYFSLFDLGLGRALTQLVSEKLGAGKEHEIPMLVWTSLALMGVLGLVGTLVLAGIAPWLAYKVLKVPEALRDETLGVLYLLSFSIPVVIITLGLRGILEAKQHFFITNAVRLPLGILTFLGPLFVLSFSNSLVAVTSVLIISRLIAFLAYLFFCFYFMPALRSGFKLQRSAVGSLIRFGGWMTISNFISPLMVYLDRLLIGVLISVTAVAYYATPWEVVTKLLLIPGALASVLFPAFSASFAQDIKLTTKLYRRGLKFIFLLLFPATLFVVTFAKDGLMIWLGADFSDNSFRVLQLLAIGTLFNGIASIPFAFIQGIGRPDVTAKFHVMEVLLYLPCAWWMINKYGINGAAFAWMLRVGVDSFVLLYYSNRFLEKEPGQHRQYILSIAMSIVILISALFSLQLTAKIAFFILTVTGFTMLSWFGLMGDDERYYVKNKLGISK
jgi:O-antigen/teichoic acid export membrane protein